MQITDDFKSRIKSNEGSKEYQIHLGYFRNKRYHLYRCSQGFRTIGFGHNCEAEIAKNPRLYQDGITEAEAEQLLDMDIQKAVTQANYYFNIKDHNLAIQQLVVELVFQLGIGTLLKFKKFKAAIDRNDYKAAANELLDSAYAKQTPQRVQKHVNVLRGI